MIILAREVVMAMSLHFFRPSIPLPPGSSNSLAHNHLLSTFHILFQTVVPSSPRLSTTVFSLITNRLNRPPPSYTT